MILTFNPDGTTDGFNNPETVEFLEKLGDTVFRQEAKMTSHRLSQDMMFFAIWDEAGHKCPLCQEKKNAFVEIINERRLQKPKVILICKDCLGTMHQALLGVG